MWHFTSQPPGVFYWPSVCEQNFIIGDSKKTLIDWQNHWHFQQRPTITKFHIKNKNLYFHNYSLMYTLKNQQKKYLQRHKTGHGHTSFLLFGGRRSEARHQWRRCCTVELANRPRMVEKQCSFSLTISGSFSFFWYLPAWGRGRRWGRCLKAQWGVSYRRRVSYLVTLPSGEET